jgi:enediyne biosynthesis protein E7
MWIERSTAVSPVVETTFSAAGSSPAVPLSSLPLPPGPRGHRVLGCLFEVRRDRIGFVDRLIAEHGSIVSFRMPGRCLVLLAEPEAIRRVLVTNQRNYHKGLGLQEARPLFGEGLLTADGATWSADRKAVQRAFDRQHLEPFAGVVQDEVGRLVTRWRGRAAHLDAGLEATRFALAVLGRTFLAGGTDADLGQHAETIERDLLTLARWAMNRMAAPIQLSLGTPLPSYRRARQALDRLEAVIAPLLASGAAGRGGPMAIAGLLGDAAEPPSTRRLRDQLLTFLVAGHETTASSLTWLLLLLARHPEAQEAVSAELEAELGGRPATVADLPRLRWLGAAVDEALRLYPAVWMISRKAQAEDSVAGYRIPKGADLLVSVYALHRSPEHWQAPAEFRPERFLAGGELPAFLPFGLGMRACIGRAFGRLELQLALAGILQAFRLGTRDHAPMPLEPLLTLRPGRPVELQLEALPPG